MRRQISSRRAIDATAIFVRCDSKKTSSRRSIASAAAKPYVIEKYGVEPAGVHDRVDPRRKLARAGRDDRPSELPDQQHRVRGRRSQVLASTDPKKPAATRRYPLSGDRGGRHDRRRPALKGRLPSACNLVQGEAG